MNGIHHRIPSCTHGVLKLPDKSTDTPDGKFNLANIADDPSPLNDPLVLLPAMVVMMPVDTVTFRMRLLYVSAMYTLPMIDASHA